MARNCACFVDRDGTLIREVGYLYQVDQIELLPRVEDGIRLLQSRGLKVVLVTNQSAVARGLIDEAQLHKIHREMESRLAKAGAVLDGIYYCPHHPTEGEPPYRALCQCRKPKPGLIQRACLELGLEAGGSYVVGDQRSDMELALRVGAKGLLVGTPPAAEAQGWPRDADTAPVWARAESLWGAALIIARDMEERVPKRERTSDPMMKGDEQDEH
jgi:D-glycero-D-manno-heptose 1,7-bisphosphate phosphatase